MDTFLVGGAVRDRLLGLTVQDRDWVVVGATPDDMTAAGFLPVGRDFPVFLHPVTREEHALARTERKTGAGYRGFAFDASRGVTLEQDLSRRDLTINAIAERADGTLVDPHGGQRDLQMRVLRHVSPAFAEDPVRILRLARFAARFGDFRIAEETEALLRQMVANGEADALVPERVWRELARGLMEPRPARMLGVLHGCGALARLLPEIVPGARLDATLAAAVELEAPLAVRFACLFHGDGDDAADAADAAVASRVATLCERLRVPADCRDLAVVVAREHRAVEASASADAETLLRWLERTDALRRPQRLDDVLLAAAAIALGAGRSPDAALGENAPLRRALVAARRVDTAAVARDAATRGLNGPAVGEAVHAARVAAVGSEVGTRAGAG